MINDNLKPLRLRVKNSNIIIFLVFFSESVFSAGKVNPLELMELPADVRSSIAKVRAEVAVQKGGQEGGESDGGPKKGCHIDVGNDGKNSNTKKEVIVTGPIIQVGNECN